MRSRGDQEVDGSVCGGARGGAPGTAFLTLVNMAAVAIVNTVKLDPGVDVDEVIKVVCMTICDAVEGNLEDAGTGDVVMRQLCAAVEQVEITQIPRGRSGVDETAPRPWSDPRSGEAWADFPGGFGGGRPCSGIPWQGISCSIGNAARSSPQDGRSVGRG